MNIHNLINHIRNHLTTSFEEINLWFEKDNNVLDYIPENGGWNVRQILEHIYLTNYYLLILVKKGARKALKNIQHLDLETEKANYQFQKEKFDEIGTHLSFQWIRPEHMEPKGEYNLSEIQELIHLQYRQCIEILNQLPNGEGLLYKTTMTVNNLGKINVYEYIYFISLHAQRHMSQMKNNELEYFLVLN